MVNVPMGNVICDNMKKLAILMATYNAEQYLNQQIDSIMNQTYKDFDLYIHDDGSTDKTLTIIKKYCKKYKNIIFIDDNIVFHSACKNFFHLINYIKNKDYDYIAFSDQDDVWNSDKVETTINQMMLCEKTKSKSEPILIHSDLYVVDNELNVLSKSFMKYRALDFRIKSLNRLFIQNNVTGCTMLINRALLELLPNYVDNIIMHDWWIALTASAFGTIYYLDIPTMKYRQHGNNVVGAVRTNSFKFIKTKLKKAHKLQETINMSIKQSEVFKSEYIKLLSKQQLSMIDVLVQVRKKNKIQRMFIVLKYKFLKQGLLQILGELVFI